MALQYAIRWKIPQFHASTEREIRHENAPAYSAQSVQQLFASYFMRQVKETSYA